MVTIVALIFFICTICAHRAVAIEQKSIEQEYTITSVPMQSVVLPCKAALPHKEPREVIWYKLSQSSPSTPLSVNERLITKDPRLGVTHYSHAYGFSPAKWDLHITNIRISDAALYQCHVTFKDNKKSIRSNVKLHIEDIIVDIQPMDILVSIGETAQFSCNFTGEHRVHQEKVTWLKDGKSLVAADSTRVITSTEFPNITTTTLKILVSHVNDSGSYRCSNGRSAKSREAKLHLRDTNQQVSARSLSSLASILFLNRTVFYFFVFSVFFRCIR